MSMDKRVIGGEIRLVLLNLDTANLDPRTTCAALRSINPSVRILVSSMEDQQRVLRTLPDGVAGSVQKSAGTRTITEAITDALGKTES